jgi:hypothetical protein
LPCVELFFRLEFFVSFFFNEKKKMHPSKSKSKNGL